MRKDIETMNKNKAEMKNVIPDTKNTLEGSERRLDEVDDQISHLNDKVEKTTPNSNNKKKKELRTRMV